jgi:nicotinamidase/pyrazinamidase
MKPKFQAGDALLIVDPQNDFMPGGALAVPNGDEIIPILNDWIAAAEKANIPVIVSRDWHPPDHTSFQEQGGRWPVHCVRETPGAAFHKDLKIPKNAIIVDKAFTKDKEAYSAFEGITHAESIPLLEKLQTLGIKRIWIGGLALDYCVHYSAVGAHKAGLEYHVILPACRSIAKNTEEKAIKDMEKLQTIFETEPNPYKE